MNCTGVARMNCTHAGSIQCKPNRSPSMGSTSGADSSNPTATGVKPAQGDCAPSSLASCSSTLRGS